MSYSDPSGYFFKKLVKGGGFLAGLAWGGIVGGIAQGWLDHNVHKWIANSQTMTNIGGAVVGAVTSWFCGPCSIGFSALYASNMASYNGATTSGALKAGGRTAAVATVFYGIGQGFRYFDGGAYYNSAQHVAAHAVTGGVIAKLQGGNFGNGFFAAGLTKGFHASGAVSNNVVMGTLQSAVVGGTASEISGGKFANGAMTATFQYLYNHAASSRYESSLAQANNSLSMVGDVVGKIWNLPNTLLGLVYGGVGHVVGWMMGTKPYITFGNNAIQFVNNPFTDGATTLGNVVVYQGGKYYSPESIRGNGYTLGYEEMQHTYQGQALGLLYFPAHIGLGVSAMISSGQYNNLGWHSSVNVLENCPHARTPSPWGC